MGDDQIASVLVRAGLADLARSHPLRLSGGQRQRLAVALAVTGSGYGDPALVLLDEPTSAQDRTGIAQVKDLIGHADAGRTTVIASHAPSVFDGLATHYLRLVDGRLVAGRSDD